MSDGKPYTDGIHPSIMGGSYESSTRIYWVHLQLTSCRLAARVVTVLVDDPLDPGTTDLFVWDWRTGKLWLVSCSIHLTRNEKPHGDVKGAHSDTKHDCSFHRRAPALRYSLSRP